VRNQQGPTRKPAAPRHLSSDARGLWRQLYATYQIDLPASVLLLTTLVEAWDRARACRVALADLPMTITDKHGGVRMHPLIVEERNCREQVARLARVLRIHIEEGSGDAA
jgi:phage terminase small subunit